VEGSGFVEAEVDGAGAGAGVGCSLSGPGAVVVLAGGFETVFLFSAVVFLVVFFLFFVVVAFLATGFFSAGACASSAGSSCSSGCGGLPATASRAPVAFMSVRVSRVSMRAGSGVAVGGSMAGSFEKYPVMSIPLSASTHVVTAPSPVSRRAKKKKVTRRADHWYL
jgi:hypothetical protein